MAALVQQRVPALAPAATKYTPNLASNPLARSTTTTTSNSSSSGSSSSETPVRHTEITPEIALLAEKFNLSTARLISSPYPDLENQLHLPDLDLPYRLFAFALTALDSTREDYATAPYLESFNWSQVFSLLQALCRRTDHTWRRTEFYVVIFRSKLKAVIDRERLGLLDQKSHEEACASGGLLKYWFGSPNAERRNLATCLWRNHEDAVAGGGGPWHKQARMAAREMYERIDFHVHKLIVEDGATSWTLEDYQR